MSLPYVEPPSLPIPIPVHIFGVIVAVGVAMGAAVMHRYAKRVGKSEADTRSVIAWVTVTGFIGAHVFDVLFYRPGDAVANPLTLLAIWTSISSYGGFAGGALGFAYIAWRRKLRLARWADITMVGLLVAFSIGRAGCTVVHDHIGAETSSFIGIDYPREALAEHGVLDQMQSDAPIIRAHNLGLEELLYLIPVNVLVLWLAFRRRLPHGAIAVLAAALYAPVRFGLEHWRLTSTDPLYGGLTFAQWCSIAVFLVAAAFGTRIAITRKRTAMTE
jgi:phosphatidylglycerol:prolipoprotein diacylglycerol transferase